MGGPHVTYTERASVQGLGEARRSQYGSNAIIVVAIICEKDYLVFSWREMGEGKVKQDDWSCGGKQLDARANCFVLAPPARLENGTRFDIGRDDKCMSE